MGGRELVGDPAGLQNISGIGTVATTGTDVAVLWKAVFEAKVLLAGRH